MPYTVNMSAETLKKIREYKTSLVQDQTKAGKYLQERLEQHGVPPKSLDKMPAQEFITCLMETRKPQVFAELETVMDGTDWNKTEAGLLGDISVTMNVHTFDTGAHVEGAIKKQEQDVRMAFMSAPLLKAKHGIESSPDFSVIGKDGEIDTAAYNAMIERRLLPCLQDASNDALKQKKRAVVVVPGLGCGAFAGAFEGKMQPYLDKAIQACLEKHADHLKGIDGIVFDGFKNMPPLEQKTIGRIKYASSDESAHGRGLLSDVSAFESELGLPPAPNGRILNKIVAWDHFSFPGNDFWVESRATDDGVSFAVCSAGREITGIKGVYETRFILVKGKETPVTGYHPVGYKTWKEVAEKHGILMKAENCIITRENGQTAQLVGDTEHPTPELKAPAPTPKGPTPPSPTPSAPTPKIPAPPSPTPLGPTPTAPDKKVQPDHTKDKPAPNQLNLVSIMAVAEKPGVRPGNITLAVGETIANEIRRIDPQGILFQRVPSRENQFIIKRSIGKGDVGFYTSLNNEPSVKLPDRKTHPEICALFDELILSGKRAQSSTATIPSVAPGEGDSIYFPPIFTDSKYADTQKLGKIETPQVKPDHAKDKPAPSLLNKVSITGFPDRPDGRSGHIMLRVGDNVAEQILRLDPKGILFQHVPSREHKNWFIIKRSTGKGDVGFYTSLNNEPSVKLPDRKAHPEICALFDEIILHGNQPQNSAAIIPSVMPGEGDSIYFPPQFMESKHVDTDKLSQVKAPLAPTPLAPTPPAPTPKGPTPPSPKPTPSAPIPKTPTPPSPTPSNPQAQGYIDWLKSMGVRDIEENVWAANRTSAKSKYMFASPEAAKAFKDQFAHIKDPKFDLNWGQVFEDKSTGKTLYAVSISENTVDRLKQEFVKEVKTPPLAHSAEPQVADLDKQIADLDAHMAAIDNALAKEKFDKVVTAPDKPTAPVKPMARGAYKDKEDHIKVESRITKAARLLSNKDSGGWWEHAAAATGDIMAAAYLAKNWDILSDQEKAKLSELQKQLVQTDERGEFVGGLKADANFSDFVKEQLRGEDPKRKKERVDLIREDVKLLLDGGSRVAMKNTTPSSVRHLDDPTQPHFKQPAFFPDKDGKSGTDTLVLQAGGMDRHSSMRVLKKEKDDKTPGGYRYYYTKIDAGGGAEDLHDGTAETIYTTEIVPKFKTKVEKGNVVVDCDGAGNPKPLSDKDLEDLRADPIKYQEAMKATLFALLSAEREILVYKNPKLAVGHGESEGITEHDKFQWNFQNNKIKALRGKEVPERCRRTQYQVSGNCTVYSLVRTMEALLVDDKLAGDMLQDFKRYDTKVFADLRAEKTKLAEKKAKLLQEKKSLEAKQPKAPTKPSPAVTPQPIVPTFPPAPTPKPFSAIPQPAVPKPSHDTDTHSPKVKEKVQLQQAELRFDLSNSDLKAVISIPGQPPIIIPQASGPDQPGAYLSPFGIPSIRTQGMPYLDALMQALQDNASNDLAFISSQHKPTNRYHFNEVLLTNRPESFQANFNGTVAAAVFNLMESNELAQLGKPLVAPQPTIPIHTVPKPAPAAPLPLPPTHPKHQTPSPTPPQPTGPKSPLVAPNPTTPQPKPPIKQSQGKDFLDDIFGPTPPNKAPTPPPPAPPQPKPPIKQPQGQEFLDEILGLTPPNKNPTPTPQPKPPIKQSQGKDFLDDIFGPTPPNKTPTPPPPAPPQPKPPIKQSQEDLDALFAQILPNKTSAPTPQPASPIHVDAKPAPTVKPLPPAPKFTPLVPPPPTSARRRPQQPQAAIPDQAFTLRFKQNPHSKEWSAIISAEDGSSILMSAYVSQSGKLAIQANDSVIPKKELLQPLGMQPGVESISWRDKPWQHTFYFSKPEEIKPIVFHSNPMFFNAIKDRAKFAQAKQAAGADVVDHSFKPKKKPLLHKFMDFLGDIGNSSTVISPYSNVSPPPTFKAQPGKPKPPIQK